MLDEVGWSDKPDKSARNNRSVNIAKFKSVLAEMGAIELSKNADNWKICYDLTKISIDYADYLSLIRQKKVLNKARVQQLIRIVENGPLLSEVQYEWLEDRKSTRLNSSH